MSLVIHVYELLVHLALFLVHLWSMSLKKGTRFGAMVIHGHTFLFFFLLVVFCFSWFRYAFVSRWP